MAAPPGFPVTTREASILVGDQPAQVFASLYADRIMFVVAQVGTLGTLVSARKDTVLGGGTTFATDVLLGARDDPAPELAARQIVEALSAAGCDLPVLLAWGLARGDASCRRDVVRTVVNGCLATGLWTAAAPPPAAIP